MRNIYLVAMIAGVFVLLAGTFVYAHSVNSDDSGSDYNHEQVYDNEYMDQMHEQVVSQIDNPELVEGMNQMHELCMGSR